MWEPRFWPTLTAFSTWLDRQPRPTAWHPRGSTYHNTYIPDESAWAGLRSLKTIQATYMQRGWVSGPHLFLAVGTRADGIYQMTPLSTPGTHAIACNQDRFGIETVANWDVRPPTAGQLDLLIGVLTALHRWAGIGPVLATHRECVPGRTCPGRYGVDAKPRILSALTAALTAPGWTADSPLMAPARGTLAQYQAAWQARCADSPYDAHALTIIPDGYWQLASSVGLDPWLVAGQVVHETGGLTSWWSQRPRRNPAGIGVTGATSVRQPRSTGWVYDARMQQWREGCVFDGWLSASIPAHLGRLLAYATDPLDRTPDQQRLVNHALTVRDLPLLLHGTAPTAKQLGAAHNPQKRGWAHPGDSYGTALAAATTALWAAGGGAT